MKRYYNFREIRADKDTLYLESVREYREAQARRNDLLAGFVLAVLVVITICCMFWHAAKVDARLQQHMQDERASAMLFYGGAE